MVGVGRKGRAASAGGEVRRAGRVRLGGMRGRAAGIAVVVGGAAIVAVPAAGASGAGLPGSGGNGAGATPILSVRRVPDWLAANVAAQKLQSTLGSILGSSLGSAGAPAGCLVVTQGDQTLFSVNGDAMLIPASNLKILTATAVLDRLGGSVRFVTSVRSGARADGGVVEGNLYLVGGGDPDLRTSSYGGGVSAAGSAFTSLDKLAQQVREAGITEVTGSVIGDDSRYDSQRIVPTWKPVYTTEGDVGPLSALDVNDGFVPNSTTTTTVPPAGTGGAGNPRTPPTTSASGSRTTTGESSNSQQLAFAAAANPAAQAAQAFATLLRNDGVRVEGGYRSGGAPETSVLVTSVDSAPLSTEVQEMLIESDDTAAELFTKELGYQQSHSGTTDAGVAAVRADLEADGLPVSQLVNVDGSGLDRGDRASCDLLAAALRRAGPTGTIAKGLPVAGRTGTLTGRMLGTPAAGRLIAKTGTLDNVVSLSGFVLPAPGPAPVPSLGQPLTFSLILNGPPDAVANAIADEVGVALAKYPSIPAMSELEPVGVLAPAAGRR